MASELKKITIHIDYPQVMKSFISSKIEVLPSATLDEIKNLVFQSFWDLFTKMMPAASIHGKKEHITLKDKELAIETDTILQERLKQTTYFQAVFITHGKKS